MLSLECWECFLNPDFGDRRVFERQELARILLAMGVDTGEIHHRRECELVECEQETPLELKVALRAALGTYELCRTVQEMSVYVLARDRADCSLLPREQRLLQQLREAQVTPFLQEEVVKVENELGAESAPSRAHRRALLPAKSVYRV